MSTVSHNGMKTSQSCLKWCNSIFQSFKNYTDDENKIICMTANWNLNRICCVKVKWVLSSESTETVTREQHSFEVEYKSLLHPVHMPTCGLCVPMAGLHCDLQTYRESWTGGLASENPTGTRLGCKMDGDDGVLVVSCCLLLSLCNRDTAKGTCLNTAPACWQTHTHK